MWWWGALRSAVACSGGVRACRYRQRYRKSDLCSFLRSFSSVAIEAGYALHAQRTRAQDAVSTAADDLCLNTGAFGAQELLQANFCMRNTFCVQQSPPMSCCVPRSHWPANQHKSKGAMAELEPLLADPSGDIFGDEDNDSEIATSKQAPAADCQPVDTLTLGAAISNGDDEDLLAELEVDGDGGEDEGEGDGNGGTGDEAGTGAGGSSGGDGGGGGSIGAEGSSGNAVCSTWGANAGDGVAAMSTPPTGPTTASPLDNGESLDMSDDLDSGAAGSTGTTKLGDGSGSGGDVGGGTAGGLGAGSANTASTSAGRGTGTGTGAGTGTGGDSGNAGGSKSPLTFGEIEAEDSTSTSGCTPPATQTQVNPSTDTGTTGAGGYPGAGAGTDARPGPAAGAGTGSGGAIGTQQAASSTVTEAEAARACALAKAIKTSTERGVALPAPSSRTVSDARAAAEQAGLCPGVSLTILLELAERMQVRGWLTACRGKLGASQSRCWLYSKQSALRLQRCE